MISGKIILELLKDSTKVDELLESLNATAGLENSYEYGLPLYDNQKELLRKDVLLWLMDLAQPTTCMAKEHLE